MSKDVEIYTLAHGWEGFECNTRSTTNFQLTDMCGQAIASDCTIEEVVAVLKEENVNRDSFFRSALCGYSHFKTVGEFLDAMEGDHT